ncbi:MAG: UvrB/UvrC motif-containing protein [Pirellulales bacterium]|nr:UvrB/UvrC motif-containing protein [Pirellulales bacterium]
MAKRPPRQDIDHVLRDWPHEPGEISVRLVEAHDGREVLQMRVELGVMQLETTHRPDGQRPGGAETYFDYLLALAIHEGDGFTLTEEQCNEVDRELVQFYHRRICWLALREYEHAVRDADHNLAFMDFVRSCSPADEWTESHEQYRPFILFHRTQAAALAELEERGPEPAIETLNTGLDRLREIYADADAEEPFEEDEMVARLVELRESLRDQYNVGQTLSERLADAISREQYELAAQLRDQIAHRAKKRA